MQDRWKIFGSLLLLCALSSTMALSEGTSKYMGDQTTIAEHSQINKLVQKICHIKPILGLLRVGPRGPKGDKGDTGAQGPPGTSGLTTFFTTNSWEWPDTPTLKTYTDYVPIPFLNPAPTDGFLSITALDLHTEPLNDTIKIGTNPGFIFIVPKYSSQILPVKAGETCYMSGTAGDENSIGLQWRPIV
jgi:hypothetical protein